MWQGLDGPPRRPFSSGANLMNGVHSDPHGAEGHAHFMALSPLGKLRALLMLVIRDWLHVPPLALPGGEHAGASSRDDGDRGRPTPARILADAAMHSKSSSPKSRRAAAARGQAPRASRSFGDLGDLVGINLSVQSRDKHGTRLDIRACSSAGDITGSGSGSSRSFSRGSSSSRKMSRVSSCSGRLSGNSSMHELTDVPLTPTTQSIIDSSDSTHHEWALKEAARRASAASSVVRSSPTHATKLHPAAHAASASSSSSSADQQQPRHWSVDRSRRHDARDETGSHHPRADLWSERRESSSSSSSSSRRALGVSKGGTVVLTAPTSQREQQEEAPATKPPERTPTPDPSFASLVSLGTSPTSSSQSQYGQAATRSPGASATARTGSDENLPGSDESAEELAPACKVLRHPGLPPPPSRMGAAAGAGAGVGAAPPTLARGPSLQRTCSHRQIDKTPLVSPPLSPSGTRRGIPGGSGSVSAPMSPFQARRALALFDRPIVPPPGKRSCALCGVTIDSHVFMLHDQPYCTSACRLKACREKTKEASGGRSRSNSGRDIASRNSGSCSSHGERDDAEHVDGDGEHFDGASSTGLVASYRTWTPV